MAVQPAPRRGTDQRFRWSAWVWSPCGALGWLRLLSEWVGPDGQVVGTDIQDEMLAAARQFITAAGLGNVTLVNDDLFASQLEPVSFDLVYARALIFPLRRGPEQMATHLRLVRSGGIIGLEEVDPASLPQPPATPALDRLKPLVIAAFRKAGGDPRPQPPSWSCSTAPASRPTSGPSSRRWLPAIPACRRPAVPHRPGRLLRSLVDLEELERLRAQAEHELQNPGRWGLDLTLVQGWGRRQTLSMFPSFGRVALALCPRGRLQGAAHAALTPSLDTACWPARAWSP